MTFTMIAGIGVAMTAVFALWAAFKWIYRVVSGRNFIFTTKMARFLSAIFGAVLTLMFVRGAVIDVQTGAVTTGGRGQPYTAHWDREPKQFVFSLALLALESFLVWRVVAAVLTAAAEVSEKTKP